MTIRARLRDPVRLTLKRIRRQMNTKLPEEAWDYLATAPAERELFIRIEQMVRRRGDRHWIKHLDDSEPGTRGVFLKWLWENRKDILEFIMEIWKLFNTK